MSRGRAFFDLLLATNANRIAVSGARPTNTEISCKGCGHQALAAIAGHIVNAISPRRAGWRCY
jgi:hypothetical protein